MKSKQKKTGLISIITPVFNSEKYLQRCIESIISQSYKKTETILVNDGSLDNSGKICNKYTRVDKKIKVINIKNSGPAAARNVGLKRAKGEFIFFLDADDYLEKNALETLIYYSNKHKAEMIVGDFNNVRDDLVIKRRDVLLKSKLLNKQDLVKYTRLYLKKPNKYLLFAYSWNRLFKSSIIKNRKIYFNPKLYTFEDVAFNFNYLKYTNAVFFLKKTIYNHNVNANYLSATMNLGCHPKKLLGYRQAFFNINVFLKNQISDAEIKKEIGHADISLTIIQLVRICGQINKDNKKKIFQFIRGIVNDVNFRDNLKDYSPRKGDSKVLPLLIKLKFLLPIIWICKYKAYKRYKNN